MSSGIALAGLAVVCPGSLRESTRLNDVVAFDLCIWGLVWQCQRLQILVPVGLMFCKVRSATCIDFLFNFLLLH